MTQSPSFSIKKDEIKKSLRDFGLKALGTMASLLVAYLTDFDYSNFGSLGVLIHAGVGAFVTPFLYRFVRNKK